MFKIVNWLYYSMVTVDASEDLYQVSILIDQLKHDELQTRVNASKSITRIGIL